MGLAFTNIKDRHGAAVYLLSDGLSATNQTLTRIAHDILGKTPDSQVVMLDNVRRGDGLAVANFYSIQTFPAILIVMDDDTVPYSWTHQLPKSDQISYQLNQINGGMRTS